MRLMEKPISAYTETLGMAYFPRMLNKIRLKQAGMLDEEFHPNLGKGLDGRCVDFLRIDYDHLVERVLQGGTDEEILTWCFSEGRDLNENDLVIWNGFATKYGWNDGGAEMLATRKREGGWENNDSIQTFAEYFEYDEGRKS